MHFNCLRNDGEMKSLKVQRTWYSINGGSLEITHVFHLSIIINNNIEDIFTLKAVLIKAF